MVTSIHQVIPSIEVRPNVSDFFVRKMMQVLTRQGQIEPLQVRKLSNNLYQTFSKDPHGNDILEAARRLGWPTILIVEMNHYQE